MIPLFHPAIPREEWISELDELFKGKQLAQGPKVDEFEKKFGKKFGYKYCVAVNSGSAALELAFHLANIGYGIQEVLTPVLTCSATQLPIIRRSGELKFVDINMELTANYWDMVKKFKEHQIEAIVVTELGGLPYDRAIGKFARKNKVPLIVDACQSLGIPTKGDFIAYSFQAIKHFNTGDGGMLVCKKKADYERAKRLRWFGIDREKRIKSGYRAMTLNIKEPGYKFQMNDIAATMGLVGLKHSDEWLRHRQFISTYYENNLLCDYLAGGSYWLGCIFVDKREKIIEYLKKRGIETNLVHVRNDIYDCFGGKREKLELMNKFEPYYLYIPLHQNITLEQAEYVVKHVNEAVKKYEMG